ncbi:MAG: putative toxin [Elusimicrobiota bacterium]
MKGNDSQKDGIISRTVKKIKKLFGFGGDIDPKLRGLESEKRILRELGLKKNTIKISTEEGSSIPDALDENNSVEIKDSKYVSRTRQLRIQTESAQKSNRQSILIVGKNTRLSKTVQEAFDLIIRHSGLGGKND